MKRGMVSVAVLVIAVVGSLGSAGAADCGPDGSPTNGSGSCDTATDQVRCGQGVTTPAGTASIGTTGAEFCNDGDVLPLQGRVGAQQECNCIYIDGDDDNNHDLLLNGWLRVGSDGVRCRERAKPGSQSYNSSDGQPIEDCFS